MSSSILFRKGLIVSWREVVKFGLLSRYVDSCRKITIESPGHEAPPHLLLCFPLRTCERMGQSFWVSNVLSLVRYGADFRIMPCTHTQKSNV